MSTAFVITVVLALALVLGVPTWLGLRAGRALTDGLNQPDRCGVTPPGRLIDGGRIMDPTRLERSVE